MGGRSASSFKMDHLRLLARVTEDASTLVPEERGAFLKGKLREHPELLKPASRLLHLHTTDFFNTDPGGMGRVYLAERDGGEPQGGFIEFGVLHGQKLLDSEARFHKR